MCLNICDEYVKKILAHMKISYDNNLGTLPTQRLRLEY